MLSTIYLPWYIPWYIPWYKSSILWWCVATLISPRGSPPENFTFFAENLKNHATFQFFRNILTFYQESRCRNLSRIRDLVNTVLFRQGSVSKLARGEKL